MGVTIKNVRHYKEMDVTIKKRAPIKFYWNK